MEPENPRRMVQELRTQAYLDFGKEFLRSGRYAQALAAFEEGIQNDPESIRALMGKSLALTRVGRYGEALAVTEDMLRLSPNSPHAYNARGVCFQAMGLLEEARAAFEQSIHYGPRVHGNLYNFACYWASAGDAERCREYLSRALELEPALNVLAATDVDLKRYRDEPWFQRLVEFK
jgi:tetratricopeptide (TPR) repeat protein